MAVKKTTKKAKAVKQTPPPFFETTPLKLVIMSLCTFGLYQAYWFYKMWRTANPNSTKKAAIICALLNRLFLYELLKTLQVPYAIWLAIMYFAIGFTLQSNSIWGFVASYASVIPLVYVQMRLNNRLKKPVRAPFTRRSITWAVVGLIATAGFMIGVSYLNGKVDQNAATAQPTAQHTVAKQNTKDQAASTATAQQDTASTATTPSSSTATKSAPAPASSPAKNTSTQTSSASNPANSSTTMSMPSTSVTNPNATFSIELGNSTKDQSTGHFFVSFSIVHETGHTKPVTASAYASYGSANTACKATLSGNSGILEMWFTAPVSNGFYVCTITATDGITTQSADFPIDAYH